MPSFKIRYPHILQLYRISSGFRYPEEKGPEDFPQIYWVYHLIKNLIEEEASIDLELEEFSGLQIYNDEPLSRERLVRKVNDDNDIKIYYTLIDNINGYTSNYTDSNGDNRTSFHGNSIKFHGKISNGIRTIIIDSFFCPGVNEETNLTNIKTAFNKFIEIISKINERQQDNSIRFLVKRDIIKDYYTRKSEWKSKSALGQFKPTLLTSMGIKNKLEWIPDKDIKISELEPNSIFKTLKEIPLNNDDMKYNIFSFLRKETDHFKGGKRKTNKNKKKRSKKNKTYKNRKNIFI